MKTIPLKKNRIIIAIVSICLAGAIACKDSFLDIPPTGQIKAEELTTKNAVEGLLIGSYAALTGRGTSWYAGSSNWLWGSIRGGDANKGSNAGDQAPVNPVQRFELDATNGLIGDKWKGMYEGISRANRTIYYANLAKDASESDKKRIIAEARFLRGHYYFELKKSFGNVPYVDETVDYEKGIEKVGNSTDIWPKIIDDFTFAYNNLPETLPEVGRANKWAAACYLAKSYLYQKNFTEAKKLFDLIIANGQTTNGQKYGLLPNYANVFNPANDNSQESVFATQAAVNTGDANNANQDFVLNFPYNGGPAGCCGFFQPSFDLVNSFRTNATGLPLLDGSYNNPANQVKNDQGILSFNKDKPAETSFTPDAGNLDPRLDHSVGRRGIPYLDWGPHPGFSWIRDQSYGGPYAPKKYVYAKGQEKGYVDGSSWTKGYTATNFYLIRYADVLLMAAEAEAEVGGLEKAREYVNQVRARAAIPATFVKDSSGTNAANYVISTYDAPWTDKATAVAAIRMERKLELSGEGHRFYDLVRWGIAESTLNAYFAYEGAKLPTNLGGARFTPNKHELLPIPQRQIDLQGKSVLVQNPGY
jgi:tetratricopeptide (TPR) repeat protein